MAYDPVLAQRIRDLLSGNSDGAEKKMFGGIGFLVGGNMACGVIGDELVVRVGTEHYQAALSKQYARPFDFGGRTSLGWVFVEPAGFQTDNDLDGWVQSGVEYAHKLPPK